MPQETDRLKLPLPLGNENVTRESINGIFEKIDAGVATQADLDTLREAVSKMDIPDASLTQKGKVQLSSRTDGTSETVAATEKAVRDARVAAINVATTDAIANAKSYIDTKTWQKHKLTADDGKSQLISGTDLNSLVANGQYNGNSLTNAPIPANVDEWWYIDVQCHSNGTGYVIQRASRLNGGTQTLYQRTRENNIWQPWSFDVFQSGVDAKKAVVDAINAKGGSASTNDTWATLVNKLGQIQQSRYQQFSDITTGRIRAHKDTTTRTEIRTLTRIPAGSSLIAMGDLGITVDNINYTFEWIPVIYVYLKDRSGALVQLCRLDGYASLPSGSTNYYAYGLSLPSIHINLPQQRGQASGTIYYRYADNTSTSYNYAIPNNFDISGPIDLSLQVYRYTYPNYDQNISAYSQYFSVSFGSIASA